MFIYIGKLVRSYKSYGEKTDSEYWGVQTRYHSNDAPWTAINFNLLTRDKNINKGTILRFRH